MNDIENPSLKKQYEEIVAEYNKLLERIEKACLQASKFVPQEFLNPVKEELYGVRQKDYASRSDYLKMLMESNRVVEFQEEIKRQKSLLQISDKKIITSYEKLLNFFFEGIKNPKLRTNKLENFIKTVQSEGFVQILRMIGNIYWILHTCENKKNSLLGLKEDIGDAMQGFTQCVKALSRILTRTQKDENFPKNSDFWEAQIKFLLTNSQTPSYHIYALYKDCESEKCSFNAQAEGTKLQEANEFLNKSLDYTKTEYGLLEVNLYLFFRERYNAAHWLWITMIINILFGCETVEQDIRANLKNQLHQNTVFLPTIGLYYLQKKDIENP